MKNDYSEMVNELSNFYSGALCPETWMEIGSDCAEIMGLTNFRIGDWGVIELLSDYFDGSNTPELWSFTALLTNAGLDGWKVDVGENSEVYVEGEGVMDVFRALNTATEGADDIPWLENILFDTANKTLTPIGS